MKTPPRSFFSQPPLKAYRQARNVRDLSIHSDLSPDYAWLLPRTFPCERTICRTCSRINQEISRALPITSSSVSLAVNALKQSTLERRGADWPIASGYISSMCYTTRAIYQWRNIFNTPGHSLEDIQVAALKLELVQRNVRQSKEMRHVFKIRTLAPLGMNRDNSFLWSLDTCMCISWREWNSLIAYNCKQQVAKYFFAYQFSHPEESSNAETSVAIY